jgi:DNA modification methylase
VDRGIGPQYEYDPEHNVYFEDCVEGMRERLDDDSVDMVFTSPPYNIGKDSPGPRSTAAVSYADEKTHSEFESFLSDVFKQLCRATTDTGHIFINYGVALDNAAGIPPAMRWLPDLIHNPFELKSTIIWDKKHATPAHSLHHQQQGAFVHNWEYIFHFATDDAQPLNGEGNDSVWSFLPVMGYSQESEDTGEHPAPFPVELVNRAMEATTDEGDRILDPFMGSGTTAVAAIQNNRDYVGFELDEEGAYKPIIERRISEAKRQMEANAD